MRLTAQLRNAKCRSQRPTLDEQKTMLIDMNNTISALDEIGKKPDDASLLHLLEHKFGAEVQREWALYCGRQTAALRREEAHRAREKERRGWAGRHHLGARPDQGTGGRRHVVAHVH